MLNLHVKHWIECDNPDCRYESIDLDQDEADSFNSKPCPRCNKEEEKAVGRLEMIRKHYITKQHEEEHGSYGSWAVTRKQICSGCDITYLIRNFEEIRIHMSRILERL